MGPGGYSLLIGQHCPLTKGKEMTQFIDQTPRDFLASLNPPLAQAGARGRFSKDAQAALATARAEGFLFIGDPGHPKTEVKTPRAPKTEAPKQVVTGAPVSLVKPAPAVATETYDPKEVRAWAKQNGVEVGERGRIKPEVFAAFAKAGGKPVGAGAKPIVKAPAVKVRKEKVAWGFIPRKKGDGQHISEPLLGIQNCGSCKQGIQFCGCPTGPVMPKHYGGAVALLTRPKV